MGNIDFGLVIIN